MKVLTGRRLYTGPVLGLMWKFRRKVLHAVHRAIVFQIIKRIVPMDGMNRASRCSMTRIYSKGHRLMEHIYGLYIERMLHVLSNLN